MSLFLHNGRWYVFFDFRYNGKRVRDTLAAADEFLASAESNLEAGRLRATLDSLHIATEHLAKGYLLLLPEKRYLTPKNHGVILRGLGQQTKLGNTPREYTKVLKQLQNHSAVARYSTAPLKYGQEQLGEMLVTARSMRRDLKEQMPPEPASDAAA